jgi:cytochrome c
VTAKSLGKDLGPAVVVALILAACSADPEAALESEQLNGGERATAASPAPTATAQTEPDVALSALAERGKRAYLRCRSCHTLAENAPHTIGPNLHGLFGAEAGVKPGYVFSDALIEAGIVWNDQTLDAWLENPQRMVSGNKMAFPGVRSAEDRAALIQYLRETTT